MVAAIDRVGAARIGAGRALAIVDAVRIVRCVIGESELVVFALADAPERDAQPSPGAEAFAFEIAPQMRQEQLVVPQLVGGDALADGFQHRLVGRLGEGGVIGAGPGLDDAARHQLAGARAAHRCGRIEIDAEAGGEARTGRFVIEAGIGHLRIAAEGETVLDLFLAPALRGFLEERVVGEHAAEIARVIGAVLLDDARRFDDAQQFGIELCRLETLPRNIVERPMWHGASIADFQCAA